MSGYQSNYGGPPNPGFGPPGNPPMSAPGGYPPNTGFQNPNVGGGPAQQFGQAGPSFGGYQSNPPPSMPGFSAPGAPPAFGGPGGSAKMMPPSSNNFPGAPAPQPPKTMQFFSPTGGAPVASVVTSAPMGGSGPPVSMGGPPVGIPPPSMGPPQQTLGMPPPPPSVGGFAAPGTPSLYAQQGGVSPGPGAPAGVMPPGPGGVPVSAYGTVPGYGAVPGQGAYGGIPGGFQQPGMPAGFDSGSNLAAQQGGMSNPNDPNAQGQQAANPNSGGPLPLIDEMDLSIQCNPMFMRSTVSKIVNSQSQATQSRLPIGLVCRPMCGDKGVNNDDIEVVDFGATGIVRCKRCRTYINPFVTWADNGRRWRCNICGMLNDVPSTYFSHLDSNGRRRDRDQRPELSKCSVEFVAPGDYMVRPPQPPVYFFVIDVSESAIQCGMLHGLVAAIKNSLDQLPGNPRTQIGFITFDQHIHFYNLKSTLASPQMLVVSDIQDVIIPLPEDLLVNLVDSRAVVDALLDSLPTMFKNPGPSSCTGPALMAAKRVIQHLGGKLLLFQSTLPSIGEGALKPRENPRMLGTDKEHSLLNADEAWYKTNAIDFSRLQIAIDVFLFSSQYTDVATLSVLAKYSAGTTYYYPSYHAPRDSIKFEKELQHNLTRATAFEAVMRVRATRGLRFSNFFGNYFVRGTDLLALPVCTSDSSFSLDIAYDEAMLSAQAITIQAALLYTSSAGERRIRVHTMVLPVTQSVSDMVDALDIDCAMNLLSKQACDIACKTGFENARSRVNQTTVDILRFARGGAGGHLMGGGHPGQYGAGPGYNQQQVQQSNQPIPNSLLLLPLYSMSLQKSLVLRGGTDVRVDERAYFQQLLYNMDIEESKVFIYPRMFSVHDMGTDIGLPSDNADDECPTAGPFQVRLPSIMNLSYERLTSDGIFLMENGYDMFMWVGRGVNPAIVSTLFGYPSLDNVDVSQLAIIPENSDYSSRVNAVVVALREDRSRHMQLHFIREGDGYAEAYLARYLIEDRANFPGGSLSYTEYHAHVTRAMTGLPG